MPAAKDNILSPKITNNNMWIMYTLSSVLITVVVHIGYKYILKDFEPVPVALVFNIFVLLALLPFVIKKIKDKLAIKMRIIPNKTALRAVLIGGFLDALTFLLMLKALKLGDFSIVAPIRNVTPIFSLFLGVRVLKEKTGPYIIIGTLLLTLGVLTISATQNFMSTVNIWQTIFTAPALLALAVAFLSALIGLTNKYGMSREYGGMDVLLYTAGTFLVMTVFYAVFLFKYPLFNFFDIISGYWKLLIIFGPLSALGSWLILKAYAIGNITQVSPLFRSQVLFSVLLGGVFFSEEHLLIRFFGSILLLVGIVFVVMPSKNPDQSIKLAKSDLLPM